MGPATLATGGAAGSGSSSQAAPPNPLASRAPFLRLPAEPEQPAGALSRCCLCPEPVLCSAALCFKEHPPEQKERETNGAGCCRLAVLWGASRRPLWAPRAHSPPVPPPPHPGRALRVLCPQGPAAAGRGGAERRHLHPGPEHRGEPEGAEAAAPGGRQGLHGECQVHCVWRVSGARVVRGGSAAGPSGACDEGGPPAGAVAHGSQQGCPGARPAELGATLARPVRALGTHPPGVCSVLGPASPGSGAWRRAAPW